MYYLTMCLVVMFLATAITRSLPFLFVDRIRNNDRVIAVGKCLPAAVMLLLCLQCLSGVKYLQYPFGIPDIMASVAVVLIQVIQKNSLLSISVGTLVYGFLMHILT